VVDKSFMSDKNFANKQKAANPFPETVADKAILEDKDPNFRVFDLTDENGPFNSARASYYHKSIGGYHAAKMRRYQELREHYIDRSIQNISNTFRSNPTEASIDSMFAQQRVLNMLNMRYLIYSPEAPPLKNRHALGNAWFAKELKLVNTADEELKAVGEINPANTLVVDKRYESELNGFVAKPDSTSSIKLTDYKANALKYESNAASEQVAVFSEIYYKDGWNAYIDGQLTPHFPGDWVLRALRVPAGKHTIEFKFEPKEYAIGEKISFASSLTVILLLLGAAYKLWKDRKECEVKENIA
jgi:hypothetical protein